MDVFKVFFFCLFCDVQIIPSATTSADNSDVMSHVTVLQDMLSTVQSQLQITQADQKSTSDELRTVKSELRIAEDTIHSMTIQIQDMQAEQNASLAEHGSTLDELTAVKVKLNTTEGYLNTVQTHVKDLQVELNKTTNDCEALKSQFGASHDSQVRLETEINLLHTDLKNVEGDLAVTKYLSSQQTTHIDNMKTDLHNLQTDMANVKSFNVDPLLSQVNTTLLDAISADVKSTKDELNIFESKLHKASNDVLLTNSDLLKLALNVTDFKANISSEVTGIKTSLLLGERNCKTIQKDFNLKFNSTSGALGNMEEAVEAMEIGFSSSRYAINDLNQTLTSFMHSVSNLTRSGARNIAFEVRLQEEVHSVQMGGKLIFDTLLYNNGGGFEAASGIFTAPVSGSYIFWAQIMLDQVESYLEIFLVQNGHTKGKGYAETSKETVYGVVSITTVMYLNTGDEVWFEKWKGSQNIYGSLYSGFGAALISS
ncbi:uncharacterized protein LOC124145391 [Haliotis rufescens]|uniref:uncharacterized protein LOC124145391 n=1 Tax=Haliotis rufescens TaxID=6454 RepID=UPI00201E85B3|nr:uncharacterized protein LOC124145391 [Haliotis rufescens]